MTRDQLAVGVVMLTTNGFTPFTDQGTNITSRMILSIPCLVRRWSTKFGQAGLTRVN